MPTEASLPAGAKLRFGDPLPGPVALRPWMPDDDAALGQAVAIPGRGRPDIDLAVVSAGRQPIGRVGAALVGDDIGELFWWVHPHRRRQGHGSAAVRQVVRRCLVEHGLARVQAHIDVGDLGSLALATRCGLRPEGVLRGARLREGGRVDVAVRALLREDLVDDEQQMRWAAVRAGLPTKAVAAAVLARNSRGQALVLETSYKAFWEVPGGLVEPNEGLVAATRREVEEEVGGALPVGDLLVIDASGVREAAGDIVCLLFDGGVHDDGLVERLQYPDGEILRGHWVGRDELVSRCGPRLGHRVAAGLDALATGRLPGAALVLHNGVPEA